MKRKRIWVLTLFPEYFRPLIEAGIVGSVFRGEREVQMQLECVQLRDYSSDKYKSVDDYPFGGGEGMVMRADILKRALLEGVVAAGGYSHDWRDELRVIYTSPRGRVWRHQVCCEMAQSWFESQRDLVFLCGRYEGIDERFVELYVDEEYCIGDYVLSGGEIAVMSLIDSALRMHPGVLGNKLSAQRESFVANRLEAPVYTRPREFEGMAVPQVYLSGHHGQIEAYRVEQAKRLTYRLRPDLEENKHYGP